MVQRRTYTPSVGGVPATNERPLTVAFGSFGLEKLMVVGPDTCVQVPVPDTGTFPFSLVLETPFTIISSGPALATVAAATTLMVATFEYSAGQTAFCT